MPGLVVMPVRVVASGSTFTANALSHTTVGDILDAVKNAMTSNASSSNASGKDLLYAYHKTALLHVKERLFDVFPDQAAAASTALKMAPPTLFVFDTIVQTALDACFYMFNLFKAFPRNASDAFAFSVIHPIIPSMHASFCFTGDGNSIFCIFENMSFSVDKTANGAFSFLCERGYFDGFSSQCGPQATQFVVKAMGPGCHKLKTELARSLAFALRYPMNRVSFL